MTKTPHTILFAAVLGLVCSLFLVASNQFTKPFREANEKAERIRNFLRVLEAPVAPDVGSQELIDVFERHVKESTRNGIELYTYFPDLDSLDTPTAIAVPFSGTGLWGPIKGVMALEPDLTTIRGISFYDQEETPGLGGEIGASWWQDTFRKKRLRSVSGQAGFRIVKPDSQDDINSVHGITGATMTSDRVGVMLNALAHSLQGGTE